MSSHIIIYLKNFTISLSRIFYRKNKTYNTVFVILHINYLYEIGNKKWSSAIVTIKYMGKQRKPSVISIKY